MQICKLFIVIRHAQKTATTAPEWRLSSRTSLESTQKPCTNSAMAEAMLQTRFSALAVAWSLPKNLEACPCSRFISLKALTALMAAAAQSTMVALFARVHGRAIHNQEMKEIQSSASVPELREDVGGHGDSGGCGVYELVNTTQAGHACPVPLNISNQLLNPILQKTNPQPFWRAWARHVPAMEGD